MHCFLTQTQLSKLYYEYSPQEGAVNLCTNGNQSDSTYHTQFSGGIPEHSLISNNITQSPPVPICKIFKSTVPYYQNKIVVSESTTCKNFSILAMSNASEEFIIDESFRILLNEFAPLHKIQFGRS